MRPWLELNGSGKGSERSGIMLCVDCTLYPGLAQSTASL